MIYYSMVLDITLINAGPKMQTYSTGMSVALLLAVSTPFLDGDVPCRASYGIYISQLIRFARVCNHVVDFNARNKCLTAKLLQQGYRYHKLRKTLIFITDTMN